MVLDKETGNIEHKVFRDIIEYLNPGDCLVLNNTRVIPARLIGEKLETGGKIEFLLLKRTEEDTWQALVKPGKRAKVGTKFSFGNGKLIGEVVDLSDEGSRIIKFHYDGIFEEILDELGNMPLPPYITARLDEKERYQTVYSKHNGSAAAPTAGLHFTEELLNKIKEKGVDISKVYTDCGIEMFNLKEQDVHCGGSGCGCSATVFAGYIYDKLRKKEFNKVMLVSTGALLSPTSTLQKQTIPCVAHAVVIVNE